MNEYFEPDWCDSYGNALHGYIILGRISEDGRRIHVLEPQDFREKWPTVSTWFFKRSNETQARVLGEDATLALVALHKTRMILAKELIASGKYKPYSE
jgi:hypothetical protein